MTDGDSGRIPHAPRVTTSSDQGNGEARDADEARPAQAIRLFEGSSVDRPEIVFGLVAALGTDLGTVESGLSAALYGVGYTSEAVRVSDLINDADARDPATVPSALTALDKRMDQGDALREAVAHGAAAAALAVLKISSNRAAWVREQSGFEDQPGDVDVPEHERHATIIRSLKHPEEVRLLRSVYGPRFVLVGAWSPKEEREKDVSDRLRRAHPGKTDGWYADQTNRLLARDEKDSRLGQRVRDTFELADAYVALLPGREIAPQLQRLIRLLFGAPFETPNWTEQAMYQAAGARMRSADAGRQVGAVVVDDEGELVVTGTNEVPKAGGGQYWTDSSPDHRDFRYGYDGNERQKRELVVDVLKRLQNQNGWLTEQRQGADVADLATEALEGPLSKSRIADLLEFGRVAHAEMAAICTAARRGNALGGKVMLSTTYPCHECARLIIAAGIRKVIYVDPYPKSQVPEMFRHEISDGPNACSDKVIFEPFEGIAPRLYRSVFSMPDRSRDDVTGDYAVWDPNASQPRLVAEAEATYPVQNLEDGVVRELVLALQRVGWQAAS